MGSKAGVSSTFPFKTTTHFTAKWRHTTRHTASSLLHEERRTNTRWGRGTTDCIPRYLELQTLLGHWSTWPCLARDRSHCDTLYTSVHPHMYAVTTRVPVGRRRKMKALTATASEYKLCGTNDKGVHGATAWHPPPSPWIRTGSRASCAEAFPRGARRVPGPQVPVFVRDGVLVHELEFWETVASAWGCPRYEYSHRPLKATTPRSSKLPKERVRHNSTRRWRRKANCFGVQATVIACNAHPVLTVRQTMWRYCRCCPRHRQAAHHNAASVFYVSPSANKDDVSPW